MTSRTISGLGIALLALCCFARTTPATAQTYTLTDLGAAQRTPQGNDKISAPYSLNNFGEAVGVSETPSADVATLFSNGSATIVELSAIAEGINDAGQIVGFGGIGGEASIYSNGKITGLDTAAVFPSGSQAYAVNNSGQVVGIGYLDSAGASFHAFLYSGGKMIDIGPPGAYQAWASAINDSGQIVGPWSSASGGGAFLYSNCKSVSLPGGSGVTANAINNAGQIAGALYFTDGTPPHAAVLSNGAWTDLGAYPGAIATEATGINISGQVVGMAFFRQISYHPFRPGKHVAFVVRNGVLVDLNTLIPANSGFTIGGNSNLGTVRINDSGQILCSALNAAGFNHAVLLAPK